MSNSGDQNRDWKSFGGSGESSHQRDWKGFGDVEPCDGMSGGDGNCNQNSNDGSNQNSNQNDNTSTNSNQNGNHNVLTNHNKFENNNNNDNTNNNSTGNNTNNNTSGNNTAVNEANNTNTATAENNNEVNIDVNVVSISHSGGGNNGGSNGGNNDPIARDDDFILETGQNFITGNVLLDNGNGADTDPDGDTLSVTPGTFTTANGGMAIVMADGSFFYIPPTNNTGTDSFTYTVLDGNGGDDTGTVNIARLVTQNNDPVARDDNFTKFLGQTIVSGNVLLDNGNGVDSDPDGDTLSVTPGTFATTNGGSVIIATDGSFTYTPPAGTNAPDTFEYTLHDGNGGSDTASVTIATISIENIAPVAADDDFSRDNVQNGDVITGNVLLDNGHGPDSDANGDTLSVVPQNVTTALGNTFVLLADGSFTYTVNIPATSAEQLNYEVQDGRGGSDIGSVTVALTIPLPNVPPVAQDDFFTTLKNTPLTTGNLLADNGNGIDADLNGDTLTVSPSVINTANGGIVTVLANGNFIYVPAANFVGNDTFAYILSDGNGGQDTAIVTVNVNTPGNLAPTGGDVTAEIRDGLQQTDIIIDLPDTDPDGDIISYEITAGNEDGLFAVDPSEGTITLAPGKTIDFLTPQDHTLEVTVSDGKGGFGIFNVTIVEANELTGQPLIEDTFDGLGGNDDIFGDGIIIETDAPSVTTPIILSNDVIESGPNFNNGSERIGGDAIQLNSGVTGGQLTAGSDVITNTGGGFDRTVGDFESFNLSHETLVNMGDDSITGGDDAEEIFGDVIDGFLGPNPGTLVNFGDDIINGKGGDDDLYGDFEQLASTGGAFTAGNDIFVFEPGSGHDTIWDFGQDDDKMDLTAYGITDISELTLAQNGSDTVIEIDTNNSITLKNVVAATLTNNDFILAPIALPITSSPLLTLSGLAAPLELVPSGENWDGSGERIEENNSVNTENTTVSVTETSESVDAETSSNEQAQQALDDALAALEDAVGSAGFNDLFEDLDIFDKINDAIDGFKDSTGGSSGGNGSNGSSSAGQSSNGTSSEGQSSDGEDGQSSDGQDGGNGSDGQDGTGEDASASGQDGGDGQDSSSSATGQDGQDGTPGEDASSDGQDGSDASSNGQDGENGTSGNGQDASSESTGEDASADGQDGEDSSSSSDGEDGGDGSDGGDGADGMDDSNGNNGSMSQTILNGDENDNILTGNDLVNIINGFGGNDTIDGSTAGDILTGGTGDDTFVFTQGSGRDIITDFTKGEDTIDVSDYGFGDFSDIDIFSDGFNSIVTLDGTDNQITVLGEANLTLDDFAI